MAGAYCLFTFFFETNGCLCLCI